MLLPNRSFHIIRPSRGGDVITEVMGEHQPEVWVSDLFSAQKTNPATEWQVCLAHQLRDCQYGIDAGDHIFSGRMKKLLLRALVLRRQWSDLADSTRYQYRCRLYRDLDSILALLPTQEDGLRLKKRHLALRENLFLFFDDPTIPPTNNSSEQAARSIVNTGKRQGFSAFESILIALNPLESLFSIC